MVLIDSSYADFTLMLWPKGKFKFTLANGFEGEAERIIVRGKQTQQKLLHVKQETKRDSTVLKANYNKEKESSTTVEKNKLSVGYNWVISSENPTYSYFKLIWDKDLINIQEQFYTDQKLTSTAKFLGFKLIDHLAIGDNQYYSFLSKAQVGRFALISKDN